MPSSANSPRIGRNVLGGILGPKPQTPFYIAAPGTPSAPAPSRDGLSLAARAQLANRNIANSTFVRDSPNYRPAGSQDYGLGSNPDSPGSSGISAPVGPTPQELAQLAMDQKYAGVEGSIKAGSVANQNAYTEAQARMAEFYGKAAEARKEPYAAGVQELAGNLGNIGMDFTSTDMAKDWDKNERRLQENADLALANDSTWFEKMKSTNADLYNSMLVELANTKMAEQMAMASGGEGYGGRGGSRGGGGGGSYKSGFSGDTQADENFLLEFPGLVDAINSNPNQRDAERYRSQYDRYGNPDGVLKSLQDRALVGEAFSRAAAPRPAGFSVMGQVTNLSNALKRAAAPILTANNKNDINFWRQFSPRWTPTQTNSKINTTSKQKAQ